MKHKIYVMAIALCALLLVADPAHNTSVDALGITPTPTPGAGQGTPTPRPTPGPELEFVSYAPVVMRLVK